MVAPRRPDCASRRRGSDDGQRHRFDWAKASGRCACRCQRFQVQNAAAALAPAISWACRSRAGCGLSRAPRRSGPVRARRAARRSDAIVDYAHTPEALVRLLATCRDVARAGDRRLRCGGDRDRGKRPLMAQAVARGADYAVLTSDNPRTEDPRPSSMPSRPGCRPRFRVGAHRRPARAIARAIEIAGLDDLVVIAGKGHETYQIVGDVQLHFDDREVAAAALESRVARRTT